MNDIDPEVAEFIEKSMLSFMEHYQEFLKDTGLPDIPLTLAAYYEAGIKAVKEDPLDEEHHKFQEGILKHLQTQRDYHMNKATEALSATPDPN